MRLRATSILKLLLEINAPVKRQGAVVVNVNVLRLVVSRRVNKADVAGLQEIVRDDQMLLIRSNFDIVRPNDGLVLIRIVEALRVAYIRDVDGGDVVSCCVGD